MKIGDKVVCVDDSGFYPAGCHFDGWVKDGSIYTVRGIYLYHGRPIGIHVVGIKGEAWPDNVEWSFACERFRLIWTSPAFTETIRYEKT